jgi:hypothetical protein
MDLSAYAQAWSRDLRRRVSQAKVVSCVCALGRCLPLLISQAALPVLHRIFCLLVIFQSLAFCSLARSTTIGRVREWFAPFGNVLEVWLLRNALRTLSYQEASSCRTFDSLLRRQLLRKQHLLIALAVLHLKLC